MGRYKVSKRGALPDFGRTGDVKPMVCRATQEEFVVGNSIRGERASRQGTLALGGGSYGAGKAGRGEDSVMALKSRTQKADMGDEGGVRFGWLRKWLERLARGLRGRPQPNSSRRLKRGPVQTAFQLETVRVVRNDLTEADQEVVVLKTKRSGRVEEGGANVVGVGAQRPLARIAAKLFTAGRPG
jgi:hypothetical protein